MFFCNDTETTEIYTYVHTRSLHDALPIAPELAVGIEAAIQGNGSLAIGNIDGTNTVNILLILGLSAALQPLAIQMQTLRLELPAIVIASATLLAFAWDGTLSRLEGHVLLTMGGVFTLAVIRRALRHDLKVKLETEDLRVGKEGS